MAKCTRCGAETILFTIDEPICTDCVDQIEGRPQRQPEEEAEGIRSIEKDRDARFASG